MVNISVFMFTVSIIVIIIIMVLWLSWFSWLSCFFFFFYDFLWLLCCYLALTGIMAKVVLMLI
jgi:hypothetical protein